jgi:hypothetical protein
VPGLNLSDEPIQEACLLVFSAIREGNYADAFVVPFVYENLLNFADKDDEWQEGESFYMLLT